MNKIIISQARLSSTRLPNKVLLKIENKTLLNLHLTRLLQVKNCDGVVLAIAEEKGCEELIKEASFAGVDYFVGNKKDVLDRFYKAALKYNPKVIIRVTSDCPLIDSELIEQMIEKFIEKKVDYLSNTLNPTYPDGVDVEIFSISALERAWKFANLQSEREHVTPYIWKNSNYRSNKNQIFKVYSYEDSIDNSDLRITVDEREDLELIKLLLQKNGNNLSYKSYINILRNNPKMLKLNSKYIRNSGYVKSLSEDKID